MLYLPIRQLIIGLLLCTSIVTFAWPIHSPTIRAVSPQHWRLQILHGRRQVGEVGSERSRSPESRHSIIFKQKAARVLRDELSDIICSCDVQAKVYPDERLLRGVTIADIEFTADMSNAKVFISVLGNSVEKRQVYVWLSNHVGQVRHSLAQRLRDLKRLPQIRFALADTQSEIYLNKVLDEISSRDEESAGDESCVEFEEIG